jgi:hypothetical protein
LVYPGCAGDHFGDHSLAVPGGDCETLVVLNAITGPPQTNAATGPPQTKAATGRRKIKPPRENRGGNFFVRV